VQTENENASSFYFLIPLIEMVLSKLNPKTNESRLFENGILSPI